MNLRNTLFIRVVQLSSSFMTGFALGWCTGSHENLMVSHKSFFSNSKKGAYGYAGLAVFLQYYPKGREENAYALTAGYLGGIISAMMLTKDLCNEDALTLQYRPS
jgi:hypothetical protein